MKSWTIPTKRSTYAKCMVALSILEAIRVSFSFLFSLWLSTNMCQNTFILFRTHVLCIQCGRASSAHKLKVINVSKMKPHQIYLGAFYERPKSEEEDVSIEPIYRSLSFLLRALCWESTQLSGLWHNENCCFILSHTQRSFLITVLNVC